MERRQANWQAWQRQLSDEREKRTAQQRSIPGSPIPVDLADASMKALRAKSRLVDGAVDPEKLPAIRYAEELRETGEIVLPDGRKKKSLFLFGKPGMGKTGCLLPIYFNAENKGVDVYFVSFVHLMRMVRDGYRPKPGEPTASEIVNRACDAELLFIDDLGHTWEEQIKSHSVGIADDILRWRHSIDAPMLITSNLEPNLLAQQLTAAVYQRIAQRCVVCKVGGKLLRPLN